MSITAFPVLARILTERKMLTTHLGAVAIACAAVDDITGWTTLAVLMLLARATYRWTDSTYSGYSFSPRVG